MRLPTLRHTLAVGIALVLVVAAGGIVAVEDGAGENEEPASGPRILWGIGDQLGPALESPLYRDGIAAMVTAWFNGPGDLDWMRDAQGPAVERIYAAGGVVELVVWLDDDPDYAISERFTADLRLLTRLHKGPGPHHGPLYVVLFTEFETYRGGDPAYQASLLAAYRRAVGVIHQEYDRARVALGFGGYGWDGVQERDLAPYRDAIAASDFLAVQLMEPCEGEENGPGNGVFRVRASVRQLGRLGKPVMLSHFKLYGPEDCQRAAFERFTAEMFTTASLGGLARDGLFAWSFMADDYINQAGREDGLVRRTARHRAALRPRADLPTAGLP